MKYNNIFPRLINETKTCLEQSAFKFFKLIQSAFKFFKLIGSAPY